MDKVKETLREKDISKDLLSSIESTLEDTGVKTILVTSSKMTSNMINAGISSILEHKIRFVHTLGSAACYSDKRTIELAIKLTVKKNHIVVTTPDNLYLCGNKTCLNDCITKTGKVKIVSRYTESLDIAKDNPDNQIVLLSSGYEKDIPALAGTIIEAKNKNIENLSVIVNHKLLAPAIRNFLGSNINIDGYMAPGDNAIITGTHSWQFIPEEYHIPVVISGFDSKEFLYALDILLKQIQTGNNRVENAYSALVNEKGNPLAQEKTFKVFRPKTSIWRGYGLIPFSGLAFNEDYAEFDALKKYELPAITDLNERCLSECILANKNTPEDCSLYKKECRPSMPIDSLMAIENGICRLYYLTDKCLKSDITSFKDVIE
jgi:hydrogenase expression/formation protein HypD